MAAIELTACATTRDIVPGQEQRSGSVVHLAGQTFVDIVESEDARIAGENRLTLDLDVNPNDGSGKLQGTFVLTPHAGSGRWEGELVGSLAGGKVTAAGLARGRGDFEGAVLRLDFRQIDAHPHGQPPCAEPKAFFTISGVVSSA